MELACCQSYEFVIHPLMGQESIQTDFRGKRVTVMGLGRFGGGVAVVRFLAERGASVTVTDLLPAAELEASLAQLDGCPLTGLHLDGHRDRDFTEADLIVVNPAVPQNSPYLDPARRRNVPLTSEMNLFWQHNRGRVIGVTGTNGKSTTAAMIHCLLQAAGLRCWLGGNIGNSLLPVVDEIMPHDWVVLELSSFQLEDLNRLKRSPQVAVVTNFSANHLDRHGSVTAYRQAKQTILRWQRPDDIAILNGDDPDVSQWMTQGRIYLARRDSHGAQWEDVIQLPGEHNRRNAMLAACAAATIGVPDDAIRKGLQRFTGLTHRLQFVAEINGRRFYNDSKATTPEATIAALGSFSHPVILLAGGYDKRVDLSAMAEAITENTKAVALMGQTAQALAEHMRRVHGQWESPGEPTMRICGTFDEAFRWAVEQSQPGDVILLSPGCASYDSFRNFDERGNRFVELVQR